MLRAIRSLRFIAPAACLLVVALARQVPAESEGAKGAAPTPSTAPAAASAKAGGADAPQQVLVGLYLQAVPEIDIKTNSFLAEFYMWFVWSGDIDPTLTYEFNNLVQPSELVKIPIFVDASGNAAPDLLPDGRHLQQFHVYGRFGQPFPLQRYPFDDHDITISLEDARHDSDQLVFVLDTKGTTMRPDLVIPGWQLNPMKTALSEKRWASTFGDPRVTHNDETYSHVDFSMHIVRPVVGIVSKTIIPIALIILITFGAFFLQPSDIDARLCLTITALISAVALQFTAATELPPTGSLLLLDKIYILSYLAILAVTFLSIASNRRFHAEQHKAAALLDRFGLYSTALVYFGALGFFVSAA